MIQFYYLTQLVERREDLGDHLGPGLEAVLGDGHGEAQLPVPLLPDYAHAAPHDGPDGPELHALRVHDLHLTLLELDQEVACVSPYRLVPTETFISLDCMCIFCVKIPLSPGLTSSHNH